MPTRFMTVMSAIAARWTEDAVPTMPDPIDHPALRAMTLRELADLPIEPHETPRTLGRARGRSTDAAVAVRPPDGARGRHGRRSPCPA